MILLIDNYDSFSYNVYQQIAALNEDIAVYRNDAITPDAVEQLAPAKIVLSPGPKYPSEAGICEAVIRRFGPQIPILGICLGHQAICEAYGATIRHAKQLMHGKQSAIQIKAGDDPLFAGLPNTIKAARYHSLIADHLPEALIVTATDDLGEVMAVRHRKYPVFGVQFHPESILTPDGNAIMENFICKL
jgi:anthranilate synthase component 2